MMKRELTVPRKPRQYHKDPQFFVCDVMNGGTTVAQVSCPNDVECLKFAHLFSAAPELLAQLKAANELLSTLKQTKIIQHHRRQYQHAIAKAENPQN